MEKSIYSKQYGIAISLLKEERINAGISQEELAKRLKTTQTFISKCERKDRRLDLIESYQFCEAIGLDVVDYMMELKERIDKEIAQKKRN